MTNIVTLNVKRRTRRQRLAAAFLALWRVLQFFWHETFGVHNPFVTRLTFEHGRRLLWMECDCGATWDSIEPGEVLEP